MNTLINIIELLLEWACYAVGFMTAMVGLILLGWGIREHFETQEQLTKGDG
jgi:hypothetical protein